MLACRLAGPAVTLLNHLSNLVNPPLQQEPVLSGKYSKHHSQCTLMCRTDLVFSGRVQFTIIHRIICVLFVPNWLVEQGYQTRKEGRGKGGDNFGSCSPIEFCSTRPSHRAHLTDNWPTSSGQHCEITACCNPDIHHTLGVIRLYLFTGLIQSPSIAAVILWSKQIEK